MWDPVGCSNCSMALLFCGLGVEGGMALPAGQQVHVPQNRPHSPPVSLGANTSLSGQVQGQSKRDQWPQALQAVKTPRGNKPLLPALPLHWPQTCLAGTSCPAVPRTPSVGLKPVLQPRLVPKAPRPQPSSFWADRGPTPSTSDYSPLQSHFCPHPFVFL